jgi:beta-lactamase class A
LISRRWAYALAVLLVAGCATGTPHELARDVDQILHANRGKTIAVACFDLRDGTTFLRNEKEVFHAASTMKVPVMLGIFEAVSRGALRLDQPVRVRNEFTSIFDGSKFTLDPKDDSDNQMYALIGHDVPLELLVRRMIVRSSNLATNNVIELIGAKQVMALMQRIGANDIRVLRGVEDQKAFDAGMNNTTTAYDLMLIFRALGERKTISADASQRMIEILEAQEFNSGIPAGLPRGTPVAHKTGDITRVAHDAGLVFRSDGSSYVLVVLTKGFPRLKDANRVIASISRAVWRARMRDAAHTP